MRSSTARGSTAIKVDSTGQVLMRQEIIWYLLPMTVPPKEIIRIPRSCIPYQGDIRTSVAYNNDYVYFATKGGYLYRVKMNQNGTFGQVLGYDLGGMATATPVIYKGRIYIGVCGQGCLFNPDVGHHFDVITESEDTLSLAYSVLVAGYPGGIYMLEDSPGQTEGMAEEIFTPYTDQQQYSISTLCVDKDGTIYYKNDSNYLLEIEKNGAYLNGVSVSADTGKVTWNKTFRKI